MARLDRGAAATITTLATDDLDAALGLSAAEGWNQTAADWRRLLGLEPFGCFAARAGGRLIGTVTTTTYGRALAWIGMMVVHPDARRRGIGAALMGAALDHLHARGIAAVMLDATPAGRPLYESLGFRAQAVFERWQGVAAPAPGSPALAAQGGRAAVFALDRAAYGADRSRLLESLAADASVEPLVLAGDGASAGYALARAGRLTTCIGPLVANGAAAADRLFEGMLERLAGREVGLDLHRGGLLQPERLAARGLEMRRALIRMRHGPAGDAATAPAICAGAGPEFG